MEDFLHVNWLQVSLVFLSDYSLIYVLMSMRKMRITQCFREKWKKNSFFQEQFLLEENIIVVASGLGKLGTEKLFLCDI